MEKHIDKLIEMPNIEVEKKRCTICEKIFQSNEEIERNIKSAHTKQFNCEQRDFQAGTRMIINKHINLKHQEKRK